MKKLVATVGIVAVVAVVILALRANPAELVLERQAVGVLLAAVLLVMTVLVLMGGGREQRRTPALLLGLTAILVVSLLAFSLLLKGPVLDDDEVVTRFQRLFYSKNLQYCSYLGVDSIQYPTDQWIMQEIISEVKPDFIIETGTWYGATSLYYANLLERVNPEARVITLDLVPFWKQHWPEELWQERIDFIEGSSTDPQIVAGIAERVAGQRVLVTLDSDHTMEHVLQELGLYAPLVSPGSYIVVQDTHLGGNPNYHESVPNEGPMGAVRRFLADNPEFEADRSRERYLLTQNPSGYLRRIKATAKG